LFLVQRNHQTKDSYQSSLKGQYGKHHCTYPVYMRIKSTS